MATIIFGVIGATVGGLIAGPGGAFKGAMMGWSIGTTLGSIVESASQHFYTGDMGRTNDLRVTVASYGTSIPIAWGKVRLPGIVIWSTDLIEHETDSTQGGGSGGPKVTTRVFTYTVSFAMALCRGGRMTSGSIKKIYADDLVVYDSTKPVADNLINPRFYIGSETQNADPLIIASAGNTDIPAGTDNPAFRGLCYMVVQDMVLTQFGNRVPNFSVLLDTGQLYASDVITDCLNYVGIDSSLIDVTRVTAIPVTGGLIASRIDAKSAMQPFLTAYNIDLVDVDGTVRAVPRGGASVATLTFDDMGAQTVGSGLPEAQQRISKTRKDNIALPKRVDIGYYSPSIDLQQATQSAIRQTVDTDNLVSMSLPLTLGDDEARQLAERELNLAWVERMDFSISVLPKWAMLSASDIVLVQTDSAGKLQRARVIEAEDGLMGEIKLKLLKDNDAVLTQVASGSTPTGGLPTLDPVPTTFFVWSGTELRNQDGISPGIYVAATGNAGWQGCTVLISTDGGTNYVPAGGVGAKAVFGSVASALGSTYTPNSAGFDATETVDVDLSDSNGTLTGTSENSVTNGQGNYGLILKADTSVSNASNYEIFGFANVSLVGSNVYTLSDLLRSQRNTLATGHSGPSEVFVLLNSALSRITVASALVGNTILVKCVSPGQDPTGVTAQEVYIATPTAPYASTADIASAVSGLTLVPSIIDMSATGAIPQGTAFLMANTAGGSFTATLPNITSSSVPIAVKNTGGNSVTIAAYSGNHIDNTSSTTDSLGSGDCAWFVPDNSTGIWQTIHIA